MIRVIYRWRVSTEGASGFPEWWHAGTLRIRSTFPGALGSTLLHSREDTSVFVGVARWETEEGLQAFWGAVETSQFNGAELEDMQIFEELDDLTISGG